MQELSNPTNKNNKGKKKKSLGSWFPKASVIKTKKYQDDEKITICLFYQYIKPLWSSHKKDQIIRKIEQYSEQFSIGGRMRIAEEGINATISSIKSNITTFINLLKEVDEHFLQTDFKYIDDLPIDRAFKDIKVLPVKELVYYGISPTDDSLDTSGIYHLEPTAYHEKLGQSDTVVIDVRNTYESDIGRFSAQTMVGGAELLIPDMRKSTDFPTWIEKKETKEKLLGKNILMYCTGGVRCEKASSLLKTKYGSSIQDIYQLKGGIERYLQDYSDGGYWEGKNFVFDKREAIGVGCKDGVGGIVVVHKDNKNKASTTLNEDNITITTTTTIIIGECCVCSVPWDRYIGKKKCDMCGVPVLLCDSCCSLKGMIDKNFTSTDNTTTYNNTTNDNINSNDNNNISKKSKKKKQLKANEKEKKRLLEIEKTEKIKLLRCPLCVLQNCTIPVNQINITANGKRALWSGIQDFDDIESNIINQDNNISKAANTVCKWGGGYSNREEKVKRRKLQQEHNHTNQSHHHNNSSNSNNNIKNVAHGKQITIDRICKFGNDCTRSDCWFKHISN